MAEQAEMAGQICPACGCTIVAEGFWKKGTVYCCEPCASDEGQCNCGCCEVTEAQK